MSCQLYSAAEVTMGSYQWVALSTTRSYKNCMSNPHLNPLISYCNHGPVTMRGLSKFGHTQQHWFHKNKSQKDTNTCYTAWRPPKYLPHCHHPLALRALRGQRSLGPRPHVRSRMDESGHAQLPENETVGTRLPNPVDNRNTALDQVLSVSMDTRGTLATPIYGLAGYVLIL